MIPDFDTQVFAIVARIPRGKVTTYGQIAYLLGFPRHARLVGSTLKNSPLASQTPCHRVVNSSGRLVPNWEKQRLLLESEQVPFKANGCVALKRAFWQGQ